MPGLLLWLVEPRSKVMLRRRSVSERSRRVRDEKFVDALMLIIGETEV
jgi:hypothetical protein